MMMTMAMAIIMHVDDVCRLGRKQTIAVFHVIAGVGLIASGICFNYQGTVLTVHV